MSTTTPPTRTALVLGGGGITGIAWELGVLSRLLEAGVPVDDADLVVGTSAGSVVGTMVRLGRVDEGLREQFEDVADLPSGSIDPEVFQQTLGQALAGATTHQEARARIGALARETPVVADEPELVTAMRDRFGGAAWPGAALTVCTVDATDGTFRPLDAGSGVDLYRAVAASCSVPVVWPTVEVDGRPTMDGGVRSGTNADLADAYDRVLVLSCGPELDVSPLGPTLPQVVAARRTAGREVLVVEADAESLRAFGTDVLATSTRRPAAEAGRRQADTVLDDVRAFWTGVSA
ncbi:patatin-like phospholipase family protein [Frigoribacterium sp. VKM Ac-2836]|uniref:patatin-like phospholipase family protein n=1 Tax=Frigoribacterium sp. VKM Ac-2836 TaxID=2739014 RepID=UPI001566EC70|nr:patatin-like phospholipase family protein [Frigoribacterium sp. VKM Ac-2836]NRD26173.1 patatin-like phospholipase family protein [Frigoribacterium sp. VKM Ac-2836]